jgi:hypothetical protein
MVVSKQIFIPRFQKVFLLLITFAKMYMWMRMVTVKDFIQALVPFPGLLLPKIHKTQLFYK